MVGKCVDAGILRITGIDDDRIHALENLSSRKRSSSSVRLTGFVADRDAVRALVGRRARVSDRQGRPRISGARDPLPRVTAVVSDRDAQRLLRELSRRGIESCLRSRTDRDAINSLKRLTRAAPDRNRFSLLRRVARSRSYCDTVLLLAQRARLKTDRDSGVQLRRIPRLRSDRDAIRSLRHAAGLRSDRDTVFVLICVPGFETYSDCLRALIVVARLETDGDRIAALGVAAGASADRNRVETLVVETCFEADRNGVVLLLVIAGKATDRDRVFTLGGVTGLVTHCDGMRLLVGETRLSAYRDRLGCHRDVTGLVTDRDNLLARTISPNAVALVLPRAAADVDATAIGIRRAVRGSAADLPPGIARVRVAKTVVPVQILRVTISVVQIGKVLDGFARVVLDLFRAGVVRDDETAADVANGIHEKSRHRLTRAGRHVRLRSLVENARDLGGGSARGGCGENLAVVQQELCVAGATRDRHGIACDVARTAADDRERRNLAQVHRQNIYYESVTGAASRRCDARHISASSRKAYGRTARGRTSRNRLERTVIGIRVDVGVLRITGIDDDRIHALVNRPSRKRSSNSVRLPGFVADRDAVRALVGRRARVSDRQGGSRVSQGRDPLSRVTAVVSNRDAQRLLRELSRCGIGSCLRSRTDRDAINSLKRLTRAAPDRDRFSLLRRVARRRSYGDAVLLLTRRACLVTHGDGVRLLVGVTRLSAYRDRPGCHRDVTCLKTDRDNLLAGTISTNAVALVLSRAAADVDATAIGIRRAVRGSAADLPPGIARVRVAKTVVPVQILRVTISVVQIGKVLDGFARVVLDLFRAGVVRDDETAADVANGIHEKSRHRLTRAGRHVRLRSLVENARDLGGGSARGGCGENLAVVQQELCVAGATRDRHGIACDVARTAADDRERRNLAQVHRQNIYYESVTGAASRRCDARHISASSRKAYGCTARGRTSRNRL